MGDGHQGHAGPTHRIGGTELLQPAVVGPGPAEGETGIGYLASMQAGPERRGLLAGDCVTVSKNDLA